jgi:hypothetical protein
LRLDPVKPLGPRFLGNFALLVRHDVDLHGYVACDVFDFGNLGVN